MQIKITPEYLASQGLSPTFPDRFWAKVNKDGPIPAHRPELGKCWVWTASHAKGYGHLLAKNNKGHPSYIYSNRAAWLLQRGPIRDELKVLHRCDHRGCVRPDHLFLGTCKDNTRDMIEKGRQAKMNGELCSNHKLTTAQVVEIRRLKAGGESLVSLAAHYGITKDTVWRISKRRTWKHV